MSIQLIPTANQFSNHISHFQQQLELLKSFEVSALESWPIDWSRLDDIVAESKKNWTNIDLLKELQRTKNLPAIYCFTSNEIIGTDVHESFLLGKSTSSIIRVTGNIKGKDFFNISYVPQQYHETHCLYTGSVNAIYIAGY